MGILKKVVKTIAQPAINNYKGHVGESKVNSKLNPLIFGKVDHRQINNLILIDDNGKSHQIDHIEIRQNGIFCIETKNYIGWIFGSENQDKWTQTLYNGEKHQFINPLKQNKSHIYHMSQVLNKKYKINSVVVMVQNNANKVDCPNVVNLDDLKSYLKNFNDGTNYSIEEMDEIYNKLLAANNIMKNKEHVQNIKQTQAEIKEGICPRCGGKLIERNGKYGNFLGCSNYPKCTFILNKK
ncbi:MAG: NERD domain-containing protein [Erysipelotrichaceae bacterium]|nr:NERD domain-containing protein [Erysipelotrichaceae bacterium]